MKEKLCINNRYIILPKTFDITFELSAKSYCGIMSIIFFIFE
jgi:hypothetical protein